MLVEIEGWPSITYARASGPAAHPPQAGQQLVHPQQGLRRAAHRGRAHAPAGLAAVGAAKANGACTALDETETLPEPAAALDATLGARQNWDAFLRSARRAILEWITNAKTSTTRQARVQRTADDDARNIRANQWRQPTGRGRDGQ
jgi:hypothetical protein